MNRRVFLGAAAAGAMQLAAEPKWAHAAIAGARPQFSVMLWTLEGKAGFDRCLEMVAGAGYEGVELVGEFQRWSPAETARVRAKLEALHLRVDAMSGVKAGFAVPAESEAFLKQFGAHLLFMRALDCRRAILLSGPRVEALPPEAQMQVAVDNLRQAAAMAAKAGAEIVIEPIDPLEQPTIYLQTVAVAFRIVRAVSAPNVKVLYDLYHEQRAFGNLTEKLEANLGLVGLIHVADVPGRHEPGTGEIAYGNVFRTLAKLDYTGWIAMEFYPTGEPVATLQAAREAVLGAFAGAAAAE